LYVITAVAKTGW